MKDPVDRVVRVLSRRNALGMIWASFGVAHLVAAGGLGLLALYVPMSTRNFLILLAVVQAAVLIDNVVSIKLVRSMWHPIRKWQNGARDEESTVTVWRALATLPIQYVRRSRTYPFFYSYLPIVAFITWKLGRPWWAFAIIAPSGVIVLVTSLILRYFAMEIIIRPLLEEVARGLPSDFELEAPGLPLRWRMLAVAPLINVITGVVVAGLSAPAHAGLRALGISILIAVGVAFTISLELVLLTSRSMLRTLDDLIHATGRVRDGDLTVRVPVVATDETGTLAQSFNTMVEGLGEREQLRSAFGAYVDPSLAERVMKEGSDLAGEELEVSVLFLDIRDFTAFAERASPREVVSLLNGFWELVVPVLLRHGGHANKFIGDGLLGVFGAPERLRDHADRSVAAALEIASNVRERYRGRVGVGVGVNSGSVIAGSVGGGGRLEFTVIGDTVNTAARVEQATRKTGDDVLITHAVRQSLRRPDFEFDERPPVRLKGKREPVRLWAPRSAVGAAASETAGRDGGIAPLARGAGSPAVRD
jgi:class 3 adenylate cyclase